MRFRKMYGFALAVVVCLLAGLTMWMLNPVTRFFGSQATTTTLAGHVPPALKNAKFIQHANPEDNLRVVISLVPQHQAELNALLARQADPASADYRKYLSAAEVVQRFSPTQGDFDKTVNFLKSQNLKVVYLSKNRLLVAAEGTIGQMEQTFNVTINQYNYQGEVCHSNTGDPQVPIVLQGIVKAVMGLNNFSQLRAHHVRSPRAKNWTQFQPFGMSPQQIATAYNFPNVNNSAAGYKLSGKGVTIAIATAYGYRLSDVYRFWGQYGIHRSGFVIDLPVGGTTSKINDESTLDLEQIGAQAPGANIFVYVGSDSANSTFSMVYNSIVEDNLASIISTSWGLCEEDTGTSDMETDDQIFKFGQVEGIVIFSASGDAGAYDCKGTDKLSVDFPASDPVVTAVGGTALTLNDWSGERDLEYTWAGSGGGVSTHWQRPGWQTGVGIPKGNKRVTADVALNGDPWTGYSMYFNGSWDTMGGTSFAAPNWAALWALCEEGCGGRIGYSNQVIYRIANSPAYNQVFFDIQSGSNDAYKGPKLPGYPSGVGWDCPTGWGVPDGTALAWRLRIDLGVAPAQSPVQTDD